MIWTALIVSNFHLGQKSPWANVSLDKSLLGLISLGQRGPWAAVPWTNVSTPKKIMFSEQLLLTGLQWPTALLIQLMVVGSIWYDWHKHKAGKECKIYSFAMYQK